MADNRAMTDDVVMADEPSWPSVTVAIPTKSRPVELVKAVESILGQDYQGEIRVIVVADRTDEDPPVPAFTDRRVTVIPNTRTRGLCGARNSGTLASTTDLIAFCDDDDTWRPDKLRRQVDELHRVPSSVIGTAAIEVDYEGNRSIRLAGTTLITHDLLCRTRMAMLHSSSVVAWRQRLLDEVGLQDETIPGSSVEDWDLQLRVSAKAPFVHVDEPLVLVSWGATSAGRVYARRIADLTWMLDRHPDIAANRSGAARTYGQIAFSHAALGHRREACRWAFRSMRQGISDPRWLFTLAVVAGVPADRIITALNRRGRGI
jgi:glycosyltransferase involved in cell wall biosynthesis